jgi:hypothetical protein
MELYRSNLWNVQNETKTFVIQSNFINHCHKLRNTKYAIQKVKNYKKEPPFQPNHITNLRYFHKCGFKRKEEHI